MSRSLTCACTILIMCAVSFSAHVASILRLQQLRRMTAAIYCWKDVMYEKYGADVQFLLWPAGPKCFMNKWVSPISYFLSYVYREQRIIDSYKSISIIWIFSICCSSSSPPPASSSSLSPCSIFWSYSSSSSLSPSLSSSSSSRSSSSSSSS